jgi:hypothetical protein
MSTSIPPSPRVSFLEKLARAFGRTISERSRAVRTNCLGACAACLPTVVVALSVYKHTIRKIYHKSLYPQVCMFRGRGFCCPASPPYRPEVFNSTLPPGTTTGVPQLRRFCAHTICSATEFCYVVMPLLLTAVLLLLLTAVLLCFGTTFTAVLTRRSSPCLLVCTSHSRRQD